ncbi:MAG: hypothetical protein IJQ39_03080 [Thermoguttaceae bacterium]|nr:hypothetical protein [Thermoguttaceae bacterium]
MAYTSFYSNEELLEIGLKSVGKNVLISRKCSIYGAENISISDHCRIDDFCILSGNISIGSYVHIAAFCALYGGGGIEIGDYSSLSPRCTIFSATDDFSGNYLMGPIIPSEYTNVKKGKVTLHKFVNVGAHCVIMPGVELEEGIAIGTMSLVRKSLKGAGGKGWTTYGCVNILESIAPRSHEMEKLAEKLMSNQDFN